VGRRGGGRHWPRSKSGEGTEKKGSGLFGRRGKVGESFRRLGGPEKQNEKLGDFPELRLFSRLGGGGRPFQMGEGREGTFKKERVVR